MAFFGMLQEHDRPTDNGLRGSDTTSKTLEKLAIPEVVSGPLSRELATVWRYAVEAERADEWLAALLTSHSGEDDGYSGYTVLHDRGMRGWDEDVEDCRRALRRLHRYKVVERQSIFADKLYRLTATLLFSLGNLTTNIKLSEYMIVDVSSDNKKNSGRPVATDRQKAKSAGAVWSDALDVPVGAGEPLTLETLRAKMRRAKEISGLTGEQIGEKMGVRTGRKQAVNDLLTRVGNPGIFTIASFAQATGHTLHELLALPES